MLTLDAQIEAILFFSGEPISKNKLAEILDKDSDEIQNALFVLEERLETRGITLLSNNDEIVLGTSAEMSPIIETLKKDELNRDLGNAGLETLSIVLYKGPITRAEIDYIRGVNSNFILRNLHIRGLVEKISNPKDQRSYLYVASFKLLSFLGISKVEDLPEYKEARKIINEFKQSWIVKK
ncbi:MAG: SMC-Scp complex subunit ScpB [Patescibacteria group bacterium]